MVSRHPDSVIATGRTLSGWHLLRSAGRVAPDPPGRTGADSGQRDGAPWRGAGVGRGQGGSERPSRTETGLPAEVRPPNEAGLPRRPWDRVAGRPSVGDGTTLGPRGPGPELQGPGGPVGVPRGLFALFPKLWGRHGALADAARCRSTESRHTTEPVAGRRRLSRRHFALVRRTGSSVLPVSVRWWPLPLPVPVSDTGR